MLDDTSDRLRELAKERAGEQAKTAKHEVGEMVVDATGEYFPEEVRARRRRDMMRGFAMGVGAGMVLTYLMGGSRRASDIPSRESR